MKRHDHTIIIAAICFVFLIAAGMGLLLWLIYIIGPLRVGKWFLMAVVAAFVYVVCETLWQNHRMNKKK